MDDTTAKLASHIVATRFEDLPSTALHECKRRIIDSIACAAAASPEQRLRPLLWAHVR